MGAVAILSVKGLAPYLGETRLLTILSIGIAGISYVIMIFVFRAVKRDDILNMPCGIRIANILDKFRLL